MKVLLTLAMTALTVVSWAKSASFREFDQRAKAGERLNVVYFGASLTYSANASDPATTGFRGQVSDYLLDRYPKAQFRFFDAAIGGTPSQLALFRLERDVLRHNPDLVILDFVCNDGYENVATLPTCAYEQITRELVSRGICVEHAFFTFQWCVDAPTIERAMPRLVVYQSIAREYGTPYGDAANLVFKRLRAKEFSVAEFWPIDGGHPADFGYQVFAEAVIKSFEVAVEQGMTAKVPPAPLYGEVTEVKRDRLADGELPTGWKRDITFRNSMWFDGLSSRWMGDVACGKTGAKPITRKFRGNFYGFFGESDGNTHLDLDLELDGQKSVQNFHHGQPGRLFVFRYNAMPGWQRGENTEHTISIAPKADEKIPNGEVRPEALLTATFRPTALALQLEKEFGQGGKGIDLDTIDHARGKKREQ